MASNEYKPVTAQDAIAPFGQLEIDVEAAKRAEEAGVVDAAHVDYEKALKNYEGRSDVETLAQRRARENGVAFDEGKELRAAENAGSGVVTAAQLKASAKDREKAEAYKRAQAAATNEVSEGREVATVENDENDK